MLVGAVLITYLAVSGMQRGGNERTQTVLAPPVALPTAAPIIVEQLNDARQPPQGFAAPHPVEQADRPGRRSTSSRAHATAFATAPASKSSGPQTNAPAQSRPTKPSRAERSSPTVSSSTAGLPAWGADALRDFSGGKSSPGTNAPSQVQAPVAKPATSNADIPPPMASYRPSPSEGKSAAPAVAAKPVEPPKPEAPQRPSKPLTMDQVLNQVEEAAQAQRKQAGLKAPRTSKRDAELEELISGAMKSKTK
jgi:hypothetical protein